MRVIYVSCTNVLIALSVFLHFFGFKYNIIRLVYMYMLRI